MNDISLKAKIRNIAIEKNVSASAVLQNYLISRFLFRLAKSDYKDNATILKSLHYRCVDSSHFCADVLLKLQNASALMIGYESIVPDNVNVI